MIRPVLIFIMRVYIIFIIPLVAINAVVHSAFIKGIYFYTLKIKTFLVFLTLFAFLDLDGKPEFSPELTDNLMPDEPSKLEHEHELELELEHELDLELKLELELAELASKLFDYKQIHRLYFRNHKCIIPPF